MRPLCCLKYVVVEDLNRRATLARRSLVPTDWTQETHRALIASNQRLLQQLNEQKGQHTLEVEQYKRNFDQLRTELEVANQALQEAEGREASNGVAEPTPTRLSAEKLVTPAVKGSARVAAASAARGSMKRS